MANADRRGFWPQGMGPTPVPTMWAPVLDADVATIGIFTGDLVSKTSAGSVAQSAIGVSTTIWSVCTGARYYSSSYGGIIHRPYIPIATTGGTTVQAYNLMEAELVQNAGQHEFEGQVLGTFVMTSLGLNFAPVYTSVGSTVTGFSGMELTTSGAVTTTNQIRVYRFVDRPDNDRTLTRAKVICRLAIFEDGVGTATGN